MTKEWKAIEKDSLEDLMNQIIIHEKRGYTIHTDSFNTSVLLENSDGISRPGEPSIIYGGNKYTILVSKLD